MTDDLTALLRPMSIRALIDEAIKQVRRHFRALFLPVAVPLVIVVSPLMLLYMRSMSAIMRFEEAPGAEEILPAFAQAAVIYVVWIMIYTAGFVAALLLTRDALSGSPIAPTRSWFWGLRPRTLWTMFLVYVICGVSSLFCFFPVLYVGLILSFVLPVMATEERFGWAAIKRSARLLHYNPRLKLSANPAVKVFILFLVGWVLSMALTMFVQLPLTVVQQVIMFREIAAGNEPDPIALMEELAWIQLPSAAIGTLATALLYLYLGFGLNLLFLDVRRRREGEDLEAALDELDPLAPGKVTV